MSQHAFDQLADLATDRHQVFHPRRIADGSRQMHQVHPLQGKQIALGDYAAQALILDQANVGDVSLGHGDRCIERTVIGRQVKRRPGHVPLDGFLEITDSAGHHMT
ncbi:hypothetical protein D3C87_1221960 [compost metagenome]